jgi:hypothetical protein
LVLAAAVVPTQARAQACCAGGLVLTPGRLNMHESALVGVQVKGTGSIGSFDANGAFVPPPKGVAEGDFEQDLIATLRVLGSGQFTVVVPIVETYRRQEGTSAGGGGFGDIQVGARWDATQAGASVTIPGIAVLASVVLPTGLPPEQAMRPLSLGTDATGTGAVQGAFGAALEQSFGKVLVNLTGSVTIHSARTVYGMHTQLGPAFNAFAAVGYDFGPGPVVAVTASYTGTLATVSDGTAVPMSTRTQLRFGLATGYAFTDTWRMQGGIFADPPAAHFGQNQPLAGVGASATLFRTF